MATARCAGGKAEGSDEPEARRLVRVPGDCPGEQERREDAVDIGAGIVLVLGGARSGKSEVAERLVATASHGDPVTYIATGQAPDASFDVEWVARVAAHQARRPAAWETIEVGQDADLAGALESAGDFALVDSLGTWLAALEDFGAAIDVTGPLVRAVDERRRAGRLTVLVSEEVGLGVHPSTAAGQHFRDALGTLNRTLADAADRVLLVVAGRVLPLTEVPPE
jgi:adenosylcobinamide kinase/adenosylcobinamide-phosphate guanylyltransferase